jgi:hypothetical protein
VLAIQNNDITVYQSWDKFTLAMQKDNVSQTFALKTTGINTPISDTTSGNSDMISLIDLATKEIPPTQTDETISKSLTSVLGEEKKMPTSDQTDLLHRLLNEGSLLADIQKANDQTGYDAVTQKVKDGIQQLYKSFDDAYNSNLTIQQNISTLITLLQ